ncbi:metalloendopeptidase activity protein [Homalodisca vitripennis]|nr:metalloendopeptidase activity protein [Homalodisca vitripennis]
MALGIRKVEVQLLYHDPSLGQPVTFVMKRLEILHNDPAGLVRYHDIDRFLGNFCAWQREENPPGDDDPLHWDHALILTGLDLFVRSKNGKFSSQVVGLAPVAGMCTPTSSCTVNEGRHFESVYVVAHEIGHNLGMRHDGPMADNNCDPTSFLMSPTLGSGKITWSECSRHYLLRFLRSSQSHCLMDHAEDSQLDHTSHGVLPGERFNADQQCLLKYGTGSRHASSQPLHDLCRDLHCHRDRYTWTSHPALEGTACGENKWCRGGRCVVRGLTSQPATAVVDGGWGPWESYSECASGCLQGEGGGGGSTGIMFAHRQCNSPRPENGGNGCVGSDRKYQTCFTNQCENVPKTTVRDFADEVCLRARDVDFDLVGTGLQKMSSDGEEACTVWCYKRNGGSKSRGWTFPDGTACHTHQNQKQNQYCINGICQEFTCEQGSYMRLSAELCQRLVSRGKRREVTLGVWQPTTDCYYNCVSPGSGVRLVERRACLQCNSSASIQLCKQDNAVCGMIKSTLEYATMICTQYSERVRRLSGMGMQLSPALEDPDRSCRIACQDETVLHRFYLVNGEDGWFPFGTDCTKGDTTKKAFCIRGKCLEFGSDDTPLHESEYTLPAAGRRQRRSFDHSVTVTVKLDNQTLAEMVQYLNQTGNQRQEPVTTNVEVVDLENPVIADFSDWFKLNDVDSSFTMS